MARTTKLAKLFGALAGGNEELARAAARDIADEEDRKGHRAAAQMLRGALDGERDREFHRVVAPVGALIQEAQGPSLADVELTAQARTLLSAVVSEWRYRDVLDAAHVRRRTRLLFSGPAGCGKTLTARALGRELGMPVMTVRLSAIVAAFLGQTGSNLRQLFSFAELTPCVLLLDEFDAVGRARGNSQDVGELDRVVISLLQELDHSTPHGLIIAATNLENSLDTALWRRFDISIRFPKPTRPSLVRFARRRMKEEGLSERQLVNRAAGTRSFAEVDREIENAKRAHLIKKAEATRGG
ncbi:MAG: ATPase [Myxococcales bacterium]|nr:ATPase [Myxococcales bacterium]